MNTYTYCDKRKTPPCVVFICQANDILEADKFYLNHTGDDPSKQSYIGCEIHKGKPLYMNLDGTSVFKTKMQVESGMILLIDPCVLFEQKEWSEVCLADDTPKEIEKSLKKKFGLIPGCTYTVDGDGIYSIVRQANSIRVEGA